MIPFEYIRVSTVNAALSAYQKNPGSAYIAGGTNLVDLMKKYVQQPARLIDINPLPLRYVKEEANGIRIGALMPNSDLAANDIITKRFPLVAQALKAGASAQLRNMATAGGNILQRTRCTYFYDTAMPCNKRQPGSGCAALKGHNRMHAIFGASDQCIAVHPSDFCVALAALDARVEVQGPAGKRSIPFSDFHRLPGNDASRDNTLKKGELITELFIPENNFDQHTHYLKLRDRASYAFALLSVAAALEIRDGKILRARICMGAVAHKPWRLPAVEKFLENKPATEQSFQDAAAISMQGAKGFGHNDFKIKLAPRAIVEALSRAAANA
jgi:xanthine dehydrogenase YagS FAD-binding subunit